MEDAIRFVRNLVYLALAIVAGLLTWLLIAVIQRLGVDNVLRAVTGFGPLIVSATVGYIAFQQYRLGKAQLRANVFDRRLAAYDELTRIAELIQRSHSCSYQTWQEARRLSNNAGFLFEGNARAAFRALEHLCIQVLDHSDVPPDDRWTANPIAEEDIKGEVRRITDPTAFEPYLKLRG